MDVPTRRPELLEALLRKSDAEGKGFRTAVSGRSIPYQNPLNVGVFEGRRYIPYHAIRWYGLT